MEIRTVETLRIIVNYYSDAELAWTWKINSPLSKDIFKSMLTFLNFLYQIKFYFNYFVFLLFFLLKKSIIESICQRNAELPASFAWNLYRNSKQLRMSELSTVDRCSGLISFYPRLTQLVSTTNKFPAIWVWANKRQGWVRFWQEVKLGGASHFLSPVPNPVPRSPDHCWHRMINVATHIKQVVLD